MEAGLLEKLNQERRARRAAVVISDLSGDSSVLVKADEVPNHPLANEISARMKSGKSGIVEADGKETFIHVHVPPLRLVVIGAVHISQALAPMAQACEFDVTIIDPRTAFATPERFGNVPLLADWPAEVLPDYPLDAFTALIAVTHDPKIDDLPLHEALQSDCFYVGALGSRKTHAKRVNRLLELGCSQEQIDTIHSPIGLDIGSATPAEIAVAILAQIIETRRKGEA